MSYFFRCELCLGTALWLGGQFLFESSVLQWSIMTDLWVDLYGFVLLVCVLSWVPSCGVGLAEVLVQASLCSACS